MLHVFKLSIIGMFLIFAFACSDPDNLADARAAEEANTKANSNKSIEPVDNEKLDIKDNAAELGTLITLPFEPEDVAWRETALGTAGKMQKLTAIVRFSHENSSEIEKRLVAAGEGAQAVIEPENWFPEELVAKSQLSGDKTLKGTSYKPSIFVLGSYKTGRVIRVSETDFFIIELGMAD